jgi:hypothetical protein
VQSTVSTLTVRRPPSDHQLPADSTRQPCDSSDAYLQPNILPAGESLIWALAKQSGKFDSELRYPGEDDVYENPRMDALKL